MLVSNRSFILGNIFVSYFISAESKANPSFSAVDRKPDDIRISIPTISRLKIQLKRLSQFVQPAMNLPMQIKVRSDGQVREEFDRERPSCPPVLRR
jgi:hypothetical protein